MSESARFNMVEAQIRSCNVTDPHILAREMVARTEHPVTGTFHTLGVTVKLSDTPGSVRLPAPRLGEHTAEVLGRRSAAAD